MSGDYVDRKIIFKFFLKKEALIDPLSLFFFTSSSVSFGVGSMLDFRYFIIHTILFESFY